MANVACAKCSRSGVKLFQEDGVNAARRFCGKDCQAAYYYKSVAPIGAPIVIVAANEKRLVVTDADATLLKKYSKTIRGMTKSSIGDEIHLNNIPSDIMSMIITILRVIDRPRLPGAAITGQPYESGFTYAYGIEGDEEREVLRRFYMAVRPVPTEPERNAYLNMFVVLLKVSNYLDIQQIIEHVSQRLFDLFGDEVVLTPYTFISQEQVSAPMMLAMRQLSMDEKAMLLTHASTLRQTFLVCKTYPLLFGDMESHHTFKLFMNRSHAQELNELRYRRFLKKLIE
jgi:hypothetical protein